ncbi:hypothetical protein GCM10027347_11330 [Larkinella harenae]
MATLYTIQSVANQIAELEHVTGLSFLRSYFIYNVPLDQCRGHHRHKNNHSILFCLSGSVTVFIQSPDGDTTYRLTSPNQALHIVPSDWRVLYNFSPDCIIMALASDHFSALDYINYPYRSISNLSAILV